MERNEILKTIGFSDDFLKALSEFERSVPNIYYEVPFNEEEQTFDIIDTSEQLIITHSNYNYNHNLIVTHA
jgi:hypothetical protein